MAAGVGEMALCCSPGVLKEEENVQGQLVSTQLGVNTASFVPEAAKGESVTCPGKNTYEQFDRNEPGGSPTCKKAKVKLSKAERDALKLEREKARVEAKAKKEEERREQELERQRKREKKEAEKRKKQEELKEQELEKQRKREKKEAEKTKKQEELNLKMEAKRQKEEERKLKEEKREEEKKLKEEKSRKEKERFRGFFSKVENKVSKKDTSGVQATGIITPFSIKVGMTLAKAPRSPLKDKNSFETAVLLTKDHDTPDATGTTNYLTECRKRKPLLVNTYKERCHINTSTNSKKDVTNGNEDDDDVIIISSSSPAHSQEEASVPRSHLKLLQFCDNHRPAYFGTWNKKSKTVSARNPFRKDETLLSYEVDSDEEWEEEEPGENISHSEGEDESGEEDEEEDGFFVPHGYLSAEEGEQSDGDMDDGLENSKECRRQKQLAKAKSWEAEFARKCQPVKPVKIGCVWLRRNGSSSSGEAEVSKQEQELLRKFAAVALSKLPIAMATPTLVSSSPASASKREEIGESQQPIYKKNKMPVPEEAMPDLIRLLHGNSGGINSLIKTFRVHWGTKITSTDQAPPDCNDLSPPSSKDRTPQSDIERRSGISKRQLERKIPQIAVKEVRPLSNRSTWYVHGSVLQEYGMDPNNVVALAPLGATTNQDKTGTAVLAKTPTTSLTSTKKALKRRPEGTPTVKALFEAMATTTSPSQRSNKATTSQGCLVAHAAENGLPTLHCLDVQCSEQNSKQHHGAPLQSPTYKMAGVDVLAGEQQCCIGEQRPTKHTIELAETSSHTAKKAKFCETTTTTSDTQPQPLVNTRDLSPTKMDEIGHLPPLRKRESDGTGMELMSTPPKKAKLEPSGSAKEKQPLLHSYLEAAVVDLATDTAKVNPTACATQDHHLLSDCTNTIEHTDTQSEKKMAVGFAGPSEQGAGEGKEEGDEGRPVIIK